MQVANMHKMLFVVRIEPVLYSDIEISVILLPSSTNWAAAAAYIT